MSSSCLASIVTQILATSSNHSFFNVRGFGSRGARQGVYPLSGLVKCSTCGKGCNEIITYGSCNPRLVYNVTVYNHVDGQLSETYTTYELAIALRLFKTEFLGSLDNYYTLKDE